MITVASLFDGIGGTPLSASMCGAFCAWASEIEKFPIKVTEHHFPSMKHYGDITKINGAEVEPVNIIVGGSPCQDLSIAGKRKGMKHSEFGDDETTRSGLFMEQIRIIKEMRNKHGADFPRYMVWENVPGAFSSNSGEDFRAVLEETARVSDPTISIPRSEKWSNAGSILGNGFSISWRTFDAQYWGVPQRRRRIYLVADFRGQSAPKILFEREGLPWNIAKGFKQGQGTSGDAESGFGSTVRILNDQGGSYMGVSENITGTLRSQEHGHQPIVFESGALRADMDPWIASAVDAYNHTLTGNIAVTFTAASGSSATHSGPMVLFENHPNDSRVTGPHEVSSTATKRWGTGGGNIPFVMRENSTGDAESGLGTTVCYGLTPVDGRQKDSGLCVTEVETSLTIDTSGKNPACNQGGIAIVNPIVSFVNRGHVIENGVSETLRANCHNDIPSIVCSEEQYAVDFGRVADRIQMNPRTAVTLQANGGGCGAKTGLYCFGIDQQGGKGGANFTTDVAPTILSDSHGTPHAVCYGISAYHSNSMLSDNPHSGIYTAETSRTIDQNGGNPACNQGGIVVVASFYPQMKAESQCYRSDGISNCLVNGTNPGFQNGIMVPQGMAGNDVAATLCARTSDKMGLENQHVDQGCPNFINQPIGNKQIRRLTPLECERLQGYPDGWTDIPGASDSNRYKALGNSFAIPNAFFVISGCVEKMEEK